MVITMCLPKISINRHRCIFHQLWTRHKYFFSSYIITHNVIDCGFCIIAQKCTISVFLNIIHISSNKILALLSFLRTLWSSCLNDIPVSPAFKYIQARNIFRGGFYSKKIRFVSYKLGFPLLVIVFN